MSGQHGASRSSRAVARRPEPSAVSSTSPVPPDGACPTPAPGAGVDVNVEVGKPREPVDILLVDDRAENLLALEAILEPLGERLVRATSGDEALRHLLTGDFAAILLDVQMPGLSGFETAQLIKARERSAHIPIIFLTAIDTDDSHLFRGYEVGAVDFMAKPFRPDVLRSKVAVFVDLHRKQEQLKHQERLLRESERRELELRHRAQMLESESRLAQLVALATDAIIAMDEDGAISTFNQAAERMFGRSAAEVRGGPLTPLFTDALDLAVGVQAGMMLLTGCRASGECFPAEASVSRLDVGGQVTSTLIVRDVSEQRRAEAALRTQAASLATTTAKLTTLNAELQRRQIELQHAMNARNRFYASMSHELRTPINAIIGYGTLLVDDIYGPLNDRQRQGLVRSNKAALHLLELVNDVLDLSKIEAGKIELSLQPVGFPGLLDDLFVTVRPMADAHGSSLAFESDCRTTIVTDPRRVRQILLNLLSNAIKFGNRSAIVVSCAVGGEGGVEVTVADGGPGIAEADQERIFDEFVQLPASNAQGQGTGLGLAISRRLAQLLGGSLDVESVVGEGSLFRLLLPASADVLPSPVESPDDQASATV